MPQGPILIFDKSSLESLNLDDAVLLDNFYISNITPLFFVECLADLEQQIRSRSTPEQLVGSLADRTPESQANPNMHHMDILKAELSRQFNLTTVHERVAIAGGKAVQLGDRKGLIFQKSKELEAFERCAHREFWEGVRRISRDCGTGLTPMALEEMVN